MAKQNKKDDIEDCRYKHIKGALLSLLVCILVIPSKKKKILSVTGILRKDKIEPNVDFYQKNSEKLFNNIKLANF